MFSCDYNGWTDVPEAEREALEAFEFAQKPVSGGLLPRERTALTLGTPLRILHRKAA